MSLPVEEFDPPLPTRKLDPERTRQDILGVAREEFAEHGLSGARVDAIAARTRTTKRMIYYYFGSKEGLYLAVLERAYAEIRTAEAALKLETLPPVEAIRRMVAFTFDYQEAHPDFIRLVSIENIHHGRFLAQSEAIRAVNATVIETLAAILKRGREAGVFRGDLTPEDLHMMISAFCFFRVSNRHSFGTLFQQDLASPELREKHKAMITKAILGLLAPGRQEAGAIDPHFRAA
jgi:AcrR family transcriptional regulator